MIQNHPTDAVAVVYTEIDRVSHHYWHGLDPAHPDHRHASPEDRNVIAETYASVDESFAQILELVGDDCTVLVVSDHGFGPGTRGLRMHHVLAEAGLCSPRTVRNATKDPKIVGNDAAAMSKYLTFMDWHQTQVYMPTPGCYGLNLNLKQRQASGTVSEAERQSVVTAVTACVLGLRDPQTGGQVFEAVIPSEQAYRGPYSTSAPDLLLVPHDPALMLLADMDGPLWDGAGQTGLHRLEGIWMMRGAAMSRSTQAPEIAIEMAAGEILAAFGIASPVIPLYEGDSDVHTAPLTAGIPDGAWSVRRDTTTDWESLSPRSYDLHATSEKLVAQAVAASIPETEDEVAERLRAMGYI
jgi:predicted AlkP superfamily phosphohydrolase/phosphomutase